MSEKPVDFTVTVLPELDAVVIGDRSACARCWSI
jgi:hypothetical protein